jgi:hypothetical protein
VISRHLTEFFADFPRIRSQVFLGGGFGFLEIVEAQIIPKVVEHLFFGKGGGLSCCFRTRSQLSEVGSKFQKVVVFPSFGNPHPHSWRGAYVERFSAIRNKRTGFFTSSGMARPSPRFSEGKVNVGGGAIGARGGSQRGGQSGVGGGNMPLIPSGSGSGGSSEAHGHGGGDQRLYLSDLLREAKRGLQESGDSGKKNGVTYALFGSSGSGKSTIIRKIFIDDLYNNEVNESTTREKGVKFGQHDGAISILFTESRHADPLKGLMEGGEELIIDYCGLNEDIYKWMYAMNYQYEKVFNFVVMIDDVISVKNLPIVYQAFLTYRNMNISSVVSLQYLKLCPLAIRSSLYFCFLLPMNSNEGIEQLVKGYLAMYLEGKNLNAKISRYKQMATEHRFFLLDNLNHKCYYVDSDYYCVELPPNHSDVGSGGGMEEEEEEMVKGHGDLFEEDE